MLLPTLGSVEQFENQPSDEALAIGSSRIFQPAALGHAAHLPVGQTNRTLFYKSIDRTRFSKPQTQVMPDLLEAQEMQVTPAESDEKLNHRVLPCKHCGEMTSRAKDKVTNEVFCCSGCQGAYQLIRGLGLDNFYSLRDQGGSEGLARPKPEQDFRSFDSLEFLGESAPKACGEGIVRSKLTIQGLHCAACSWLIEQALTREAGVLSARVRINKHSLEIVFDPSVCNLSQVAKLLNSLGYQLVPWRKDSLETAVAKENRQLLIQIAIAGFFAANAMWIAIALYAGANAFAGRFLSLVGIGLGLLSVVGPGRTFLNGAVNSIQTRSPHMDLPVALGLVIGSAAGIWQAITASGPIYFDSIAMLVFLLLLGRWLKFRQQRSASQAVDLMLRLVPRSAHKLDQTLGEKSSSQVVSADSLAAGDWIEVRTGESIPADGILRAKPSLSQTEAEVDCSLLTGESKSVTKLPGESLFAGALNVGPPLVLEVTASGADSRIGKVMLQVEEAAHQRVPIVMLADRIGAVFVVVVAALASLTFLLWVGQGFEVAAANSVALLIVACPCALALATPLVIAVSIGQAANRGILVREGGSFQSMTKPGMLWLDKTGTLTTGKQSVTSFSGDRYAVELAAALERDCVHPIAGAILHYAQADPSSHAVDFIEAYSNGRKGVVDGHEILVGNLRRIEHAGCYISKDQVDYVHELSQAGESPCLIAIDQKVEAVLGLSDPVEPSARTILDRLKAQGWRVGILSGDHPDIVAQVGEKLGLEADLCRGGLTPEEKLAQVRHSAQDRKVVMVGDGANDAAALAAADVGIAVRSGVEASLFAAPVILNCGFDRLHEVFSGAKQTQRAIVTTFAVSLAYNVIAVALAMFGVITPLLAAVFMPISSLSVLALALGFPYFRKVSR